MMIINSYYDLFDNAIIFCGHKKKHEQKQFSQWKIYLITSLDKGLVTHSFLSESIKIILSIIMMRALSYIMHSKFILEILIIFIFNLLKYLRKKEL